MFSGPSLGEALKEAMRLKGVKQKDVAAEFGVSQPSVSEWVKLGRIDKAHINHLLGYFRDVVGPSHWGLPESSDGPTYSADALEIAAIFDTTNAQGRAVLRATAHALIVETANAGITVESGRPPAAPRLSRTPAK